MNAAPVRGRPRKDFVGQVFGPLTVTAVGEPIVYCGRLRSTAVCRCVCGKLPTIRTEYLRHYAKRTTCWCRRLRGRPLSERPALIMDAIVSGKTDLEIQEQFDITRQYVSLLRKRVQGLTDEARSA